MRTICCHKQINLKDSLSEPALTSMIQNMVPGGRRDRMGHIRSYRRNTILDGRCSQRKILMLHRNKFINSLIDKQKIMGLILKLNNMAYTPDQFHLLSAGIDYGAMSQFIKEYPEKVKDKVQYGFDLLWGKEKPKKPVIFGHNGGTRPKDFMSANPPILLISDKVIQVLKKEKFTGWSTFLAQGKTVKIGRADVL